MTANIEKLRRGELRKYRKERASYVQYAVYALDMPHPDGEPRKIVWLNLYATPARHYACIWVCKSLDICGYGGGYASGNANDRASAAAQNAINNAGIKLSDPIARTQGTSAIKEALKAIAEALGSKDFFIAEANA